VCVLFVCVSKWDEKRRSDVQLAKRLWNVATAQFLGMQQVQNPTQLLYPHWMQKEMNKEDLKSDVCNMPDELTEKSFILKCGVCPARLTYFSGDTYK
jgi:hypothetical protein